VSAGRYILKAVFAVQESRRLIALVCLAVVLLAALAPGASGLPVALLAPFWLFFGLILSVPERREGEACDPLAFPALSVVPSRAPPRAS